MVDGSVTVWGTSAFSLNTIIMSCFMVKLNSNRKLPVHCEEENYFWSRTWKYHRTNKVETVDEKRTTDHNRNDCWQQTSWQADMFSLPVTYYAYSRTHANISVIRFVASLLVSFADVFRDVTHRSHATLSQVLRNVQKTAAMETTPLGIVQLWFHVQGCK